MRHDVVIVFKLPAIRQIQEMNVERLGLTPRMLVNPGNTFIGKTVILKETHAAELTDMRDGLIVATSSGSTAYSLSAGGPIIDPSVNAFVVTPVCPHNINIRSVVVSNEAEIKIKFKDSELCTFSVDGNLIEEIKGNSEIIIKKGGYLNTIRQSKNSFYKKLKRKIFEKEI